MSNNNIRMQEFLKEIEKRIQTIDVIPLASNEGSIISIGDGIVNASGLSQAGFGEEVEFQGGTRGLVFNLDEEQTSIILLSESPELVEGMKVKTTGRILGVNVSENLIGRVINSLEEPLDGKPLKSGGKLYPLEKIAPGVIERQPVDTPLKTVIKAVDAMIPIGRGQRELIIGDRNTGKTAIAIDTIINQRSKTSGKNKVICIYVAIGQKESTIAQIIGKLKEEDALDYSIIVDASASNPASLQYLAPYAGCAIAEYFL